ncbi:MAG: Na+/H+ antiporter NhaA [Gammaproteobacteria bacterium]|nr:Na+/H+ antiporter NhaA [Gammaproteobacteria bacterium]MBU1600715.1 Na+/H+ antiporter NhaA [Gammaproteobacteria bacterium]MBU2435171.1 Na+/H+ antiporter NhaA [Gammaproteobacteria bacterium]MBU2448585.1 Na+/H+ antiporter NhaA [Gammaproteobacteria bacterium]
MTMLQTTLSSSFNRFFESEKSSGIVLIFCTIISLLVANSAFGPAYLDFWHIKVAGLSLEHWANDALMAVFFLFVGLELERELYVGELSNFRKALLPIIAAAGGIVVPAGIHYALNADLPTQAGAGIPMATDIAFALGVLALLGSRVPASLKVFLTALAVMDDLGAIVVIAIFYTTHFSPAYLLAAFAVFGVLIILNRLRVMSLLPYLLGGVLMWFLMLKSGVHATIAGVLLAFAIPFSGHGNDESSPSHHLEHLLYKPVAFIILPIFALANTGIIIAAGWQEELLSSNSLGILGGLVLGKPLGIFLASLLAVAVGVCVLPGDLKRRHILGAGLLGGIGFTMSIFITNLAFQDSPSLINASKMAILMASLAAGALGFVWLRLSSPLQRG